MREQKRNLKARYQTVGPRTENVTYTECYIDENGALQQKKVTKEMETFMVYFPHGHSIRVTSRERLVELGYHVKPRLVDMETGDIVDLGGDPYDFAKDFADIGNDESIVLAEDSELESSGSKQSKSRQAATANA